MVDFSDLEAEIRRVHDVLRRHFRRAGFGSIQRVGEAERCYAEVCELHRPLSPIGAALAAVDLVRSQMRAGRMGPALDTVKSMASFLKPLEKNRVASEAIRQLVRMALTGETITLELLDRVARTIEKARARRRCGARHRA